MKPDEIEVIIDTDATDGSIVTVSIVAPHGTLQVMGAVDLSDRSVVISEMHVGGTGANSWGGRRLREMMHVLLEKLDVDEIRLEGAIRTTGANPGNRPRPLRFTRKIQSPPRERAEHS